MRAVGAAGPTLLAALLLTACSSVTDAVPGGSPTPSPAPSTTLSPTLSAKPSRLPDGTALLIGSGTILDSGRGPELCLGGVATSLPPQCGGPRLRGWSWPSAGVTRMNGVTWGAFAVVGTYGKGEFTVVKRVSADEAARSIPAPAHDFTSACPEPAGGWRAEDPGRATQEARDRTLDLAAELPGYGGAWIDDHGDENQNPQTTTINVLVTRDRDAAEQRLRSVWGGPLCVATTAHTEQELMAIQEKLGDRSDILSSGLEVGADGSRVTLDVNYDDGSLQRELDGRYGAGTVVVTSALRPYLG